MKSWRKRVLVEKEPGQMSSGEKRSALLKVRKLVRRPGRRELGRVRGTGRVQGSTA